MRASSEPSKREAFRYPWWHLWRLPAFTVLVIAVALLPTIGAFVARDPANARAALVGAVLVWSVVGYYMFLSVMRLTEPQILTVDDSGIVAKPLLGPTVNLTWSQIRSVEVPRKRDIVEITLIRGPRPKPMRVDSDLRGYKELKQIVLERTKDRGTGASFSQ